MSDSTAAEDSNAAYTAEQWAAQDIRAFCRACGFSENTTEWALHTLASLSEDIVLARAAYELDQL